MDQSNGYERVAAEFLAGRGRAPATAVGTKEVRDWARTLPLGAAVVDLGCGTGFPITRAVFGLTYVQAGLDCVPWHTPWIYGSA